MSPGLPISRCARDSAAAACEASRRRRRSPQSVSASSKRFCSISAPNAGRPVPPLPRSSDRSAPSAPQAACDRLGATGRAPACPHVVRLRRRSWLRVRADGGGARFVRDCHCAALLGCDWHPRQQQQRDTDKLDFIVSPSSEPRRPRFVRFATTTGEIRESFHGRRSDNVEREHTTMVETGGGGGAAACSPWCC